MGRHDNVTAMGLSGAPGVITRAAAVRIEYRFGLILASCFLFGLAVAGYISYTLQFRVAGEQVIERSRVLLEMGLVMRAYTSREIEPLIRQLGFEKFHRQIVPSYGAQTALGELRRKFPDFRYRESSLNPTNIEDRATDWEVGLLHAFRENAELKELSGEAGRDDERHFYIARPIRMASPDCLQCHSTPEIAPASMVAQYGQNGFGWKLGDVVGMQLVEVPVAGPNAQARKALWVTLGALASVFVLTFAIFLILLRLYVTGPLEFITRTTRSTSLGDAAHSDVGKEPLNGQFHDLAQSVARLKKSLDEAIKQLLR